MMLKMDTIICIKLWGAAIHTTVLAGPCVVVHLLVIDGDTSYHNSN